MAVSLSVGEAVLLRYFGYRSFRPGQVDVVRAVLDGHDTLGVLPTGGGKSLCYQVPALVLPGLAVVLSPLISLMKDQVDRLVVRGIAAAFLNSTVPPPDVARCLLSARRGILKLLYVAPERLEAPDLLRALADCAISLVAVDEAHCISEWGHEFRPSFRRIAAVTERLGHPQIVALTATATPRVRADIARQLRLRHPRVVVGGFDRPNLHYAAKRCRGDDEKGRAIVSELRALDAPAVVYASTRASVERIARQLRRCRLRAAAYHGGLDDGARREAQEQFMGDRLDAIVATNAFGMGIDKPNVGLVMHHAMPGTLEAYYQEAGRAGRDGRPARCLLLHSADDRSTHEWFIAGTFPQPDGVRRVHAALRTLAIRRRVPVEPAIVATRCPGMTARDVAAALGLLERSGLLVRDPAPLRVLVRPLATRTRMTRELPADGLEMSLLRTLWNDLSAPAEIRVNLEDLQQELRGKHARYMLERLRDRQFVDFSLLDPEYRLAAGDLEIAVDWGNLAERRRMEREKLDAMERYAITRKCRRRVLLSYFGQLRYPERCSGCDNCRHGNP